MEAKDVTSETVQAALERVLASSAFTGSDQLKRFLRLVVERTLQGQPDQLKEYTLGVEVFERGAGYDPKLDPIVRVQARRLRLKLEEYYGTEGAADPVLITLPKGGYVPVFEPRPSIGAELPPSNGRQRMWLALGALALLILISGALLLKVRTSPHPLSVAVLPLRNYTGDPGKQYLADKATEALITELASRSQLRVASRTSSMQYSDSAQMLPDIARKLGVSSVVEGGLSLERGQAVLRLRAVDARDDRKIWAHSYVVPLDRLTAGQISAANDIAAALVAAHSRGR
jgi:TolB-like protein